MYFLYSSGCISLFQHEKVKAERLYAEVHASVTAQFADEEWKGLNFLLMSYMYFVCLYTVSIKKCFLISLDWSLQICYYTPSYHS